MNIKILLLGIITLMISCTSSTTVNSAPESAKIVSLDTTSNYFLLDFADALTAEDYYQILDTLDKASAIDYFFLRLAYTKTPEYSGYELGISDSLKEIESYFEEDKYREAEGVLVNVLSTHFVNIRAHMLGGYLYNQLGDSIKSQYHYGIYDSLLTSIYYSGDGNTPRSAYIVISTKEEYAFLNWYGLRSREQSLIYEDDHSFDLLKAKDEEAKDAFDIYFNIDLVLNNLRSSLRQK